MKKNIFKLLLVTVLVVLVVFLISWITSPEARYANAAGGFHAPTTQMGKVATENLRESIEAALKEEYNHSDIQFKFGWSDTGVNVYALITPYDCNHSQYKYYWVPTYIFANKSNAEVAAMDVNFAIDCGEMVIA